MRSSLTSWLVLTGTVSNNVQIAFGCDADGDGELALEEAGLVRETNGDDSRVNGRNDLVNLLSLSTLHGGTSII